MTTTTERRTTRLVQFKISGKVLTQQAREFVEEGKWRKGYTFLMESLCGIESQMVLDILQGKKQLTGVDEIVLVDDDAEAIVKGWLDFQFQDCFVYQEQYFRPYARISGYCRKDMTFAQQIVDGENSALNQNRHWLRAHEALSEPESFPPTWDLWKGYVYRPAYYARDLRTDIYILTTLSKTEFQPVLCEQVQVDVPLWYSVRNKAREAIVCAYQHGNLVDAFSQRAEQDGLENLGDATFFSDSSKAFFSTPVKAVPSLDSVQALEQEREQELADAKTEATYEATINGFREQIILASDCDDEFGWYEATELDAGVQVRIRVPHRAFICAALHRARAYHLMPVYEPVCPQGLKLNGDDQFHSDAWIGAGFSPDTAYDRDIPEQRLFMNELYRLQRNRLSFSFDILARGPANSVNGEVIHDPSLADKTKILVVSTASPEYADAALKCAAVVVEVGSKLAHLAIVSREEGIPVIRIEGALAKFPAGRYLTLDLDVGSIEMLGLYA